MWLIFWAISRRKGLDLKKGVSEMVIAVCGKIEADLRGSKLGRDHRSTAKAKKNPASATWQGSHIISEKTTSGKGNGGNYVG
jgi:hypothetical protein